MKVRYKGEKMKIIKGLVYTDKQYIEILEKRISKAIEFIEKDMNGVWDDADYPPDDLLKILKGEENDR